MNSNLKRLIEINGYISISTLMREALFNLKEGYYINNNPIGIQGDFITSPEISQVFGELISAYFFYIWQNNFHKQEISIVEMGAGTGLLMKDLIRYAKNHQDFIENIKFNIIEISPKLQDIQKKNLSNCDIIWHKSFKDFDQKNNKPILFVANELFDCFAIDQFVKTSQGWLERVIINKNNNLKFTLANYCPVKDKFVNNLVQQDVKNNDIFEYSTEGVNFIKNLIRTIKNNQGLALIIDYGYIQNHFTDTLQAIRNHKFCDILNNIGNSDLTSLVNFPILKSILDRENIENSLITQKKFLESLGIEIRRNQLTVKANKQVAKKINSAINRLIDPDQMGNLFKCLIFWNC